MRGKRILKGCGVLVLIFIVLVAIGAVIEAMKKGGVLGVGRQVAVVPLEGVIIDSRKVVEQLDDFRRDPAVRALVIRIDSPGGAVAPSQEIYEAIQRVDKEKPVVASLGSVAASGGYYAAIGARKIVANPGTVTGSIGVIIEFVNLEEVLAWAKIKQETIKSAQYKDIGSPFRKLENTERELLQKLVDDIHSQFVEAVANCRKMSIEDVRKLANGLVYTGKQAVTLKLIDELGDLNRAIKLAGELAGIKGEPEVIYPPEPFFKFKDLFGKAEEMLDAMKGFSNVRILYLWRI